MRLHSEQTFEDWARGAQALAAVAAWNEAGLFDLLVDQPRPISELPGDPRAVAITATVLRHLGLLVGDIHAVMLSPLGLKLKREGAFPRQRSLTSLAYASQMKTLLQEGGPARNEHGQKKATQVGVNPDSPEETRNFLDMLFRLSQETAQIAADWLLRVVSKPGRVLDLGGGHGAYALALAQRGFEAHIFDLPAAITYAQAKHQDQLSYQAGDFLDPKTHLGGPFDLIFLSNVVHGLSPADSAQLVVRASQSLAPGGWLVLKDMFLDPVASHPENAAFFGFTMLYMTTEGQSHRVDDVKMWLNQAGLEMKRVIQLDTQLMLCGQRV